MNSIENEIQLKELNAPRITPQHIQDCIDSVWYINGATGVTLDVPKGHPLELLTICVIILKNGFTVTGTSACASPENFDEEIGRKIARENAEKEIWKLEGYLLKQQLFEQGK